MSRHDVQSFEELFGGNVDRRGSSVMVSRFEAELFGEEVSEDTPGTPAATVTEPDRIPAVDTSVPRLTLYPRITLGGEAPAVPVTGVFVPQAFQPSARIDAILFLHGHHRSRAYPPTINISEHWDRTRYPLFRLREELNRSGRPLVLIAPTLGPRSEAGWLVERGGLDRYLGQVRAELLASSIGLSSEADWGNLILACHSGGGSVMRRIVSTRNSLAANITQCWGFDCLYGDADIPAWLAWASRAGKRLYIHYGSGGTANRSLELLQEARNRSLANASIFVEGDESLGHNSVPIRHWHERIVALPQ